MRTWDDFFHLHSNQVVVVAAHRQNSLVTRCAPSLNLSLQSFNNSTMRTNVIDTSSRILTSQFETVPDIMLIDTNNSSKKRKRKGSMDATTMEDEDILFLENLLQSDISTSAASPQKKSKSKRTKRSIEVSVIPQSSSINSCNSVVVTNMTNSVPIERSNSLSSRSTFCNNSHYQAKYQMSVSYSMSFLK